MPGFNQSTVDSEDNINDALKDRPWNLDINMMLIII